MYCNRTGLLHLALWQQVVTTDSNCDCPCLMCSQHHNHKRLELCLSSGQQQIPPLRDKASSISAPSTKDQSMPTLAMKVRRMLACLQHMSDALLQEASAGQVCPHIFGTRTKASLCSKCPMQKYSVMSILPCNRCQQLGRLSLHRLILYIEMDTCAVVLQRSVQPPIR